MFAIFDMKFFILPYVYVHFVTPSLGPFPSVRSRSCSPSFGRLGVSRYDGVFQKTRLFGHLSVPRYDGVFQETCSASLLVQNNYFPLSLDLASIMVVLLLLFELVS